MLTLCTRCTKKMLRVAQKTMLCQQKNIEVTLRTKNYVSQKNICCGNKKNYVTLKRKIHVD